MMNPTWIDVMKFELKNSPVIFDVGGYKGEWTKLALEKYNNATVYVFEPVKEFYDQICEMHKDNANVKVFNFGLSDKHREEKISLKGDSSSVFLNDGVLETVKLIDIREFLFANEIFHVDLIKINIEGEEYRLLEYLIIHPELNVFENFLIQFHTFIPQCIERRQVITNELSKYYNRIFNFEFIFEGWSMKKVKEINCFGDSHVSIFYNSHKIIPTSVYHGNKPYVCYHFGPYLAYNLLDKKDAFNVLRLSPKNKNMIICFGEIDCRAHVKKIIDLEKRTEKSVIDEIIERYFNFIDSIENENIIIFSVVPELKEQPHWSHYKDHQDDFDCPRGTYKERRSYKEYFNEKAKSECEKRNYKFISIYDYLVDKETTKQMYYLDDIHLSSPKVLYMINRELIKAGIIEDE